MTVKWYILDTEKRLTHPAWDNLIKEWFATDCEIITEFLQKYYPFITAYLEKDYGGLDIVRYLEFPSDTELTWFLLKYS